MKCYCKRYLSICSYNVVPDPSHESTIKNCRKEFNYINKSVFRFCDKHKAHGKKYHLHEMLIDVL